MRMVVIVLVGISIVALCLILKFTFVPPEVLYHSADRTYVDRALFKFSGKKKESLAEVERKVTPVVVHLPGIVCVGLNLKRGIAGGDTTVCFAPNKEEPTVYYINGS